jgi:uncharacterized protein (TIGR02270 family)
MFVPAVLQQHVDDAGILASNRIDLVEGPSGLRYFGAFDRRLQAHLDGLQLAGQEGRTLCDASLETPSRGSVFVAVVRALESRDDTRLMRLIALAQAVPEAAPGLLAAFEWIEPSRLRRTVAHLLRDEDGFSRAVGLAACAAHRTDPNLTSGRYFRDADARVRACAFRMAGELGIVELQSYCAGAVGPDDPGFWAAWSAVLLGNRAAAFDALAARFITSKAQHARVLQLALQAAPVALGHRLLQRLVREPGHERRLIAGTGIVADPEYVPWLIRQMTDLKTARLAGEAFALITGADLQHDALDRPAPEDFESGPTDDPDDPNVDMDPDDGLPWPDVGKIEAWWAANSHRFQKGTRSFMGAPVTREHCVHVLKTGYQRQRILAAHYLCLLEPGTPLFNTSAPAWRQQKLLARL